MEKWLEKSSDILENFYSKEELSDEERDLLRARSVGYQKISEEEIDQMIENAEKTIAEVQTNFFNRLDDQIERATLIIESGAGPEAGARENYDTLYKIATFANIQNPDIEKANEDIDRVALKLTEFFQNTD